MWPVIASPKGILSLWRNRSAPCTKPSFRSCRLPSILPYGSHQPQSQHSQWFGLMATVGQNIWRATTWVRCQCCHLLGGNAYLLVCLFPEALLSSKPDLICWLEEEEEKDHLVWGAAEEERLSDDGVLISWENYFRLESPMAELEIETFPERCQERISFPTVDGEPEVCRSETSKDHSHNTQYPCLVKVDPRSLLPQLEFYTQALRVVFHSTLSLCNAYLFSIGRQQRRRELIGQFFRKYFLKANRSHRVLRKRRTKRAAAFLALLDSGPIPRRWWVSPTTSRNWWENFVQADSGDEKWIEHFRMSRGTLFEIADMLRPQLERQKTTMREAISVEKRVAIAVWWLSNLECYREVATQFGVGRSTVGEIVLEVCFAIKHRLAHRIVYLGDYQKVS
uniref:Uncharacterized protein n=1 Tax=Varanus komodoensis TaxID=61221 RepID=A0A8D2LCT2_VARKO